MKLIDLMTGPWAIQPDSYNEIVELYRSHLRREKLDFSDFAAQNGMSNPQKDTDFEVINGAAIIPVQGVLVKTKSFWMKMCGGLCMQDIGAMVIDALHNQDVDRIILDIDSPGGTVDGTAELAQIIVQARQKMPVIAYVNGLMASAAYWAGSAASEIYISGPTTVVGSIGVIATIVNKEELLKTQGVKVHEIYAGRYKAVGSAYREFTDEDREAVQSRVDYLYSIFVETVSEHRGVDVKTVLDNMADARLFIGQQAIDAGLVDGVSTLEALIEKDVSSFDVAFETNSAAGAQSNLTHTEVIDMNTKITTVAALAKEYPDLVASIEKTAKETVSAEASAEAVSNAKAEGVKLERERIQAVQEQALPGHEALIETLKFDGSTTGEQAAVQVLKAEKQAGSDAIDKLDDNAPEAIDQPAVDVVASTVVGDTSAENGNEKHKAKWDKDAKVRAEFTSFESYSAWQKAVDDGLIAA